MKKIGEISESVVRATGISVVVGTPIFIGESNEKHMLKKHADDYIKYGCHITDIIAKPDYIGVNSKDNSIEYVKEFSIDQEFVKVAVRVSTQGKFFARSLYVLNRNRVNNFIAKGTLKKI